MTATVLHLPAPTRAILQPSIHARGARGYVYGGQLDTWHAPGALPKSGNTSVAVDGAWLVEPVLGRPLAAPAIWPGVPGAADRARALGKQVGAYPYQQDGAAFLAERDYAILADSMGLGKSPQALIAAEARLSLGAIPSSTTPVVLILCPALAKRHWEREVKRWTGADSEILNGLRPSPLPAARYIIANYDILYGARRRDAAGVMHDAAELPGWGPSLCGRFLVVICDEAHVLRGRSSRRSEQIRRVCAGVPVVWLLTGTPMPNHVRDLWAQIDLMSAGLHGKYWDWANKYCGAHQGKYGWVDSGADNLDELRQRLTYFVLGRSKEMVSLQLPPKRREILKLDVEVVAASVNDAQEALSRQKAIAGALRATARAKRKAVIEQAAEAMRGHQKVIVFTYLREQADSVAKALHEAEVGRVMCVHGDLSPEGRDAQAQVFRECAAPAAFVATIDSVGVAISLVGADLVIFADLSYEPWKLLQAESRPHRHGSLNPVLVRYLVAIGTIDEAVSEAVISKLSAIEETLGKESDGGALGQMLAGDQRSTQTIVDGLFDKLRALGAQREAE